MAARTSKSRPFGPLIEPSPMARAVGEVAFYREHNPEFGPYLRTLREHRGLSLRDAADQLGMSFAKLQKMETGGRFRIDNLHLFSTIADLYARPRAEVLEAAGIRVLEPHDVTNELDDESAFARLVLHPELRPLHMDERWLDSFSILQKKQWLEFAKRLEIFVNDNGHLSILLEPTAADRDDE